MHNSQSPLQAPEIPDSTTHSPSPGQIIAAELGFYLEIRATGFAVYMSASQRHLRLVREMTSKTLTAAGIAAALTADVQLVACELIGNSVRHCGDLVPLVVEIDIGPTGVSVKVHDPDSESFPRRAAMPSAVEAESGRGLPIVDLLAPGWLATRTPVGKQVSCLLPYAR